MFVLFSLKDLVTLYNQIVLFNFQRFLSCFSCTLSTCLWFSYFSIIFQFFKTLLFDGKCQVIQYSISIEILRWYDFARMAWMGPIPSSPQMPEQCVLTIPKFASWHYPGFFVKIIGGLFATLKSNFRIKICTYLLWRWQRQFGGSFQG